MRFATLLILSTLLNVGSASAQTTTDLQVQACDLARPALEVRAQTELRAAINLLITGVAAGISIGDTYLRNEQSRHYFYLVTGGSPLPHHQESIAVYSNPERRVEEIQDAADQLVTLHWAAAWDRAHRAEITRESERGRNEAVESIAATLTGNSQGWNEFLNALEVTECRLARASVRSRFNTLPEVAARRVPPARTDEERAGPGPNMSYFAPRAFAF